MSRNKKLLTEVLPLEIIHEVEKWPVLYEPECPERNNVFSKTKAWHEVAKNILPDWDSLSKAERHSKVIDLMKKWRNLRDTFKRQLELEKKLSEGYNVKKKQYVYFKHMKFLAPHLHMSERRDPVVIVDDQRPGPASAPVAPAPTPSHKRRARRLDGARAQALADAHNALVDIDEDKHFALSLVSSLKKMTEDEKYTAKVKILKVIKDVRMSSASVLPDSVSMPDDIEEDSLGDQGVKVEFLELDDDNETSTDDDSDE